MPHPSTEDITRKAEELGFAAAGVARLESATTFDIFARWLASGCAAGMEYLSRHSDVRANPSLLAPGAKSIIAVSARYPRNPAPGKGFSSYAWGRDYHDVVRRLLRTLADWIEERAPLQTARVCVDSAPLLERAWALQAGLGWRGKQGQVVSDRAGCCTVLGFLLVDMELEPTPPAAERCGDCRLCLDACPTKAVGPDGTIDSRRCISYWTIEHKGPIPPDIAPQLGESLFGCDRCTAVCPWNRVGEDLVLPEFLPDAPLPDAGACASMADADFERRFSGTSVHRLGPAGLRRNAALAR